MFFHNKLGNIDLSEQTPLTKVGGLGRNAARTTLLLLIARVKELWPLLYHIFIYISGL